MSATAATITTTEKLKRIGYYRDYLTPTLHRRFTRAAGFALLGCYVSAIWVGDASSYFWMIFPFGRTGIRTLLIFISVLVIFILRVAQLRIGARTATSPFNILLHSLTSLSAFQTIAFYLFSAWWFSEVCVWSSSEDAELSWVKDGGMTERDQLNERPIFLRSSFLVLAVAQALLHMYYDYGQIPVHLGHADEQQGKPIKFQPAEEILKQELSKSFVFTVLSAGAVFGCTLVAYPLFLRQIAWNWSLWFARLVWNVPRSAEPATIPPYHYLLLWRTLTASVLLMCLWQLSNLAFTAYVSQPPLKRGKPLTSESRDPNASLLNGLKSKKNLVKTNSFWELALISISDEARRKTMYLEYDRKDGSTWSQILQACLAVVEDINTRLIDTQTPPPEMSVKQNNGIAVKSLPRLSAPLKVDPILLSSPKPKNNRGRAEASIGSFAKSIGQSPSKDSGALVKGVKIVRDKTLTQEHQRALQPEHLESVTKNALTQILNFPVGFPFRQTFDRRANAKVFGSPTSEMELISFAINSLAHLAVAAIKEDSMGQVSKDIGLIMRNFGNLIARIKTFMNQFPVHWTDVHFQATAGGGRHVRNVDLLLDQLQTALKRIIEGYGKYARDMNLGAEEMKAARMAVGLPTA